MNELLTPTRFASGAQTTPLGMGTARLGAFWQGRSIADGRRALEVSLDLGIRLIDTADVYARGIAEGIIGRVVGSREDVTVMTKGGLLKNPVGMIRSARLSEKRPGLRGALPSRSADRDYSSAYLKGAAEDSLKRLKRDRIDAFLLHEIDTAALAEGRFLDAMDALKREGKIAAWGASVASVEAAEAAVHVEGLSWLQMPINMGTGAPSEGLLSAARLRGISIVGLAALGDGTLLPRLKGSGLAYGDLVSELVRYPASIEGVDAALLGMSDPHHAYDNLAAILRPGSSERAEMIRTALAQKEK